MDEGFWAWVASSSLLLTFKLSLKVAITEKLQSCLTKGGTSGKTKKRRPHNTILLKQNMAGKVTSQQPPGAGLLSESPLVVLVTRIHLYSRLSLQNTGLGSGAAPRPN